MHNLHEGFSRANKLIHEKNKILLITHEHPDGDALGSLLGMFSALSRFEGKEIGMFSPDPVPRHFRFLPFWEAVESQISFTPELVLAFDYGNFQRLSVAREALGQALIVSFDHHPPGRQEGDVLIIDPSASSTCEILFLFFQDQGYSLSTQVATPLLTGIITDTGGFAHVNTSARTLRAVAELLCCGASIASIHQQIFARKTLREMRAWGRVLKNFMIERGTGMAYAAVSLKELEYFSCSPDDFEGVVNVIQMPPQARFSLLLIEEKLGFIRGSLRSEPFKGVDVSRIARILGGGGHKYAAGFEYTGETLENVIELVKNAAMYPSG